MNNVKKTLREWFDVENRNTDLKTEFRAGFVNFLANFYLIVVVRFIESERTRVTQHSHIQNHTTPVSSTFEQE